MNGARCSPPMRRLCRCAGWSSSSCRSTRPTPRSTPRSASAAACCWAGSVLAVILSLWLARRMVRPIRALQAGAARIGAGALDHRIHITTGDELEALGINSTAWRPAAGFLCDTRGQGDRAHASARARQPRQTRFLAAASHDLRQPLHALGLLVAQLDAGTWRENGANRRPDRHCGLGDERSVQRAARHLQARCRRRRARRLRVSDRSAAAQDREHVRGGRPREIASPAHPALQRLGPQRPRPARAHPPQSGGQRHPLYRAGRHRGRMPPPRRPPCGSMCGTAASAYRKISSRTFSANSISSPAPAPASPASASASPSWIGCATFSAIA